MTANLFLLLAYELRLNARRKAEWATLVLFFILVVAMLPFAVGPDKETLRRLGPGLIWLAAALMNLLALERLFAPDERDGTLDMMLLSPLPLPLLVAVRLAAHSLSLIATLAAALPLAALFMGGMDTATIGVLAASLALGAPLITAMGGVMAAITLAAKRGAALLLLLLTPFYVPVLIFAVSAADAAAGGASAAPHLLLLAAMNALLVPLSPFAIAAALEKAGE